MIVIDVSPTQCEMRCYKKIFRPIKQSGRYAVMLHCEQVLPVVLGVTTWPKRETALSEPGQQALLALKYLLRCVTISEKARQ